jgi:hypothetical protein
MGILRKRLLSTVFSASGCTFRRQFNLNQLNGAHFHLHCSDFMYLVWSIYFYELHTHNDNKYISFDNSTALYTDLKTLGTPRRNSNPGSSALEANGMTTPPGQRCSSLILRFLHCFSSADEFRAHRDGDRVQLGILGFVLVKERRSYELSNSRNI